MEHGVNRTNLPVVSVVGRAEPDDAALFRVEIAYAGRGAANANDSDRVVLVGFSSGDQRPVAAPLKHDSLTMRSQTLGALYMTDHWMDE
jgi:hypothetical protein